MRTGVLLEGLPDGKYDLLLDDNGKMQRGATAQQEAEQCIISNKGEWKQYPALGFGIEHYIRRRIGASPVVINRAKFIRDLKVQLQADAHRDPEVIIGNDLSDFKLNIEP